MRTAIIALMLLATAPALGAEQCKFYNRDGQNLTWTGDTVIVDPLYVDAFECPLESIPNTDAYKAKCGNWSETLVIGYADNPQGAEALVWQNVFFWRRCDKDHA